MNGLDGVIERVARAIHDSYRAEQRERGATVDAAAARPWSRLTKDLKEANRAQARDITVKLELIRCTITPGERDFAFTRAELERLARHEHVRWMTQRTEAGWTYGRVRHTARRKHPSLVSWAELSEVEREKDRDVVRRIPVVLAGAGLTVVRTSPGDRAG
jgi:RyR domain-containing protein